MSDNKTDTTQLDGLDKEASGFDEATSAGDKGKSKSRTSKAKPRPASVKDDSKERAASTGRDGFSSARRVWPD